MVSVPCNTSTTTST